MSSDDRDEWLDELRDACLPAVWSRGVSLARREQISRDADAEADDEGARHLLVPSPRRPVPIHVVLVPGESDWGSDCDCRDDPCEHVVAAAIACAEAARSGEALEDEKASPASIGYRLGLDGGGLVVRRVAVTEEGDEQPLTASCYALERGSADLPATRVTAADHRVEEVLGSPRPEPVPPGRLRAVLAALRRCGDVRWQGRQVQPSPEPVLPWAVVEDAAEGWRVRLVADPELTRVLGGGLALCGEQLRPVGESRLTAAERQRFARGVVFPRARAAELVGELLPRLESRIPVVTKARDLPGRARMRPRLMVELERDPETDRVVARPFIVYGDPPVARVAGGDLEHLRGDVPQRDPEAERRLEHALGAAGLASGIDERAEGDEAIGLVGRVASLRAEVVGASLPSLRAHDQPLKADVGLEDDGRLRADFTVPMPEAGASSGSPGEGRLRADPGAVVSAWRAGREYAPLLGGRGWARLPAAWLARHGERLADLLASRDRDGRLRGAARIDATGLLEELGAAIPESERERRERLLAVVADVSDPVRAAAGADGAADAACRDGEPVPTDLRAELRGYQRVGVSWLGLLRRARVGALLADDMGLGKTLQVIAALPADARTLVVCPTSVLHEWREQLARFRPRLRVATYHGPQRRLQSNAQVTLTSHALLRIDASTLASVEWDALVLDEAQAIKNPDSQVARAARNLRAGWRVALTGTPVENRLEELWSQMALLNPGLLGSRRDFERRYSRPIAQGDAETAERLRRRLRPFVLRRTKAEVTPELPARTEVVRRCELSEAERELYETVRAATRNDVVQALERGASPLSALEALLRLRQAACHPHLVPGATLERQRAAGGPAKSSSPAGSAKLSLLSELAETIVADGHRALVFSQWTSLLDLVEPLLESAGHAWLRLDGSTSNREEVVARFQDPDGPPLMLISLKAGGTGLNLTAADHVILLDPWWNPAVEDQAADRAHRIGRTRPVMIHRLVAAETVEDRLLALQQEKRALAATPFEGTGGGAALTREDLLALLS